MVHPLMEATKKQMTLAEKHIFLVEDNPANAGIMLTALQIEGAITHFDRWGSHTVERLRGLPHIDLILMDLMLANNISGYDVFDRIKATPELAKIPVVVVSASDANVEMGKARAKGFVGYISKPINFSTFPKIVASIIEGEPYWADDLY